MNHTDELTEEAVERLSDYIVAGAYVLRTRHGFRIPGLVVEQWRERGYAVLRTTSLARKYGVGRRTMWRTIQGAVDAGFMKEIGRTEDGKAMYVPLLEAGDKWRAERNARMANHVE